MKDEGRQHCTDKGQAWTNDVLDAVFALEPVPYVRLNDFLVRTSIPLCCPSKDHPDHPLQVESIKLITLRALKHLPFYRTSPRPLLAGLRLHGELPPFRFAAPVTILTCAANQGAREVGEEVQEAAQRRSSGRGVLPVSRSPSRGSVRVSVEEAETVLAAGPATSDNAVLLLYLNENTFREDPPGVVAALVKRAFALKIPIAMVHEQDPAKGACAFSCFFDGRTPRELTLAPFKLYSTIATALYPGREHREVANASRFERPFLSLLRPPSPPPPQVSLRYVLRSMGAAPVKAGRALNVRAAASRIALVWLPRS